MHYATILLSYILLIVDSPIFPFLFFSFLPSTRMRVLSIVRGWETRVRTYLRIVAELRLIVEYVQIRVSTGLAVKVCRSRSRCHGVRIPQGFQRLVPERNIISKWRVWRNYNICDIDKTQRWLTTSLSSPFSPLIDRIWTDSFRSISIQ